MTIFAKKWNKDMKCKILFGLLLAVVLVGCGEKKVSRIDAEKELSGVVMELRGQLPVGVDELTVWSGIDLEGDAVVYSYEVNDSTGLKVMAIAGDHDRLLGNVKESLAQAEFRSFVELTVAAGRNLKYHYSDPVTKAQSDVVITHEELEKALKE